MASPLATKRLQRELKALHKNPLSNPKITAMPNENNILEWHYVLEGTTDDPKSPYKGGIYHGKLIFPKEYPYKPPGVIMCTPNGRFKPNRRLCLSMSDFHPESWNPMWSISTILMGLYSFMMDNKPTTGSIETSIAMKRKQAEHSGKQAEHSGNHSRHSGKTEHNGTQAGHSGKQAGRSGKPMDSSGKQTEHSGRQTEHS